MTTTGRGPRTERRLASVLFADLVGFTTLAEQRDHEDVSELLATFTHEVRTVCTRYGGTIEKFLGDGVLVLWGTETAHEDDAERAVRAGLELTRIAPHLGQRHGVENLKIRVGIVTGEITVSVGTGEDLQVAGDAVNTASRVQGVANPGTVWVDETTRGLTAASVTFADRGRHALKGKEHEVHLYEVGSVVAGLAGAQRQDGREAPLVGRDRELRLLQELFHATEEDGRARLVVISGAAGVGKSRLSWELEKYTDGLTRTVWWHRGRCPAYGEGIAYAAFAEMVRSRIGLADTDDLATTRAAIGQWLQQHVADPDLRGWMTPRVEALLANESIPVTDARAELFAAWRVLLECVGDGDDPVLLAVDDAHRADPGLIDLLAHLVENAQCPLFVLVIARPELLERHPSLVSDHRATVVHVERLDDAAMAELADGLVHELPPAARDALVARSEGVPLYAVETVRALIDIAAITPEAGATAATEAALTTLTAPASLRALVGSRLDALDPGARDVLLEASVLGATFTRDALSALHKTGGGTEDDLLDALPVLVRRELLATKPGPRGRVDELRFVQLFVRQVAYERLSRKDRERLHLAAATYLQSLPDPSEELASMAAQHHLNALGVASGDTTISVTGDVGPALAGLEQAVARSLRLGAAEQALQQARIALELQPTPDRAVPLLRSAARAALSLGRLEEAQQLAQRAGDLSTDPVDEARAAVLQAESLILGGRDTSAAVALLAGRFDALKNSDAHDVVLTLALMLGRAHTSRGDHASARGYTEHALQLADAHDDIPGLIDALVQRGLQWCADGMVKGGLALFQQAADLARQWHLPTASLRPLNNLAAFQNGRDLRAAIAAGREAHAAAVRVGDKPMAAHSAVNLALGLWTSGEWSELDGLLAESAGDTGAATASITHVVACWLAQARGLPMPEADPAVIDERSSEDESVRCWALAAEALEAAMMRQTDRAAQVILDAVAEADASNGLDDDYVYLWSMGVAMLSTWGRHDDAQRLLDRVASAPAGHVSPFLAAELARLTALSQDLRGEQVDVALLRSAITGYEDFGAEPFAAVARVALLQALPPADPERRPLHATCVAVFTRLGAAAWLADLPSDLSAAPVPRP
ncbi:MAG TPA: adenylate/guanylate cyclase domain-containing protein [Mycobacteriales bacterium]|nr:adenylate/guanylate cyclase domain-containing protein [Mycobacteriales bacterium]